MNKYYFPDGESKINLDWAKALEEALPHLEERGYVCHALEEVSAPPEIQRELKEEIRWRIHNCGTVIVWLVEAFSDLPDNSLAYRREWMLSMINEFRGLPFKTYYEEEYDPDQPDV